MVCHRDINGFCIGKSMDFHREINGFHTQINGFS